MGFNPLGSLLDRIYRNELNRMLEELYEGVNEVDGGKISNGSITGSKLSNNSVYGDKIRDNGVEDGKLQEATVGNRELKDSSVSRNKLRDSAVGNDQLGTRSITWDKLDEGAVTGSRIGDNAVTNEKLGLRAVTWDKLDERAVTSSRLGLEAVLNEHLHINSVSRDKIRDSAINTEKLGTAAVTWDKLGTEAVTNSRLQDNAVTNSKLINKSISYEKLNDDLRDRIDSGDLDKVAEYLSGEVYIRFELGGWAIAGHKVTTDEPLNVRSQIPHYLPKGSVFRMDDISDLYEYRLIFHTLGHESEYESATIWSDNTREYTIPDNYFVRVAVRRKDGAVMSEEDVTAVQSAVEPIAIPKNEGSVIADKAIDKFNIIGTLDAMTVDDLTDYYSEPNNITPQDFHDGVINLVNDHNDIASYELLGEDDFGYKLYKYEIKPQNMYVSPSWNSIPDASTGEALDIPKIIITSGVHGQEKNSNFAVYHFMKKLLENRENNALNTLLTNVHLVIVPLICPSGFADVTYHNRADVNLNRDFPPHGSVTQPETEYVKAVIDAHSDADLHLDFHNQTAHNTIIGYSLTDDDEVARITSNVYKYIGAQWQNKNSDFPQDRTYQWGYTSGANIGTVGRYSHSEHGMPSAIIETAVNHPFISEGWNGQNITQIGVDLLLNTISGFIQARR